MCDEVNLPAILMAAARNQLALAELLADRSICDHGRRKKLVETCRKNLEDLQAFIGAYTITLTKRAGAPRKCSAA
jgi:hypothetical protein